MGQKISTPQAGTAMPVGVILPYGGATEPAGWLFCYGQAISRTTYANLFTAFGTAHGVGDGSTTFNLPDLRGRVVAGQDDMGGSSANRLTNPASTIGGIDGDTLGGTGGAETHALTTAQLANHSHAGAGFEYMKISGGGGTRSAPGGSDFLVSYDVAVGNDAPHNNVQPTIILNYIVKAL